MAESLFASLKRELVDISHFKTIAEGRLEVFEWVIWYNRKTSSQLSWLFDTGGVRRAVQRPTSGIGPSVRPTGGAPVVGPARPLSLLPPRLGGDRRSTLDQRCPDTGFCESRLGQLGPDRRWVPVPPARAPMFNPPPHRMSARWPHWCCWPPSRPGPGRRARTPC
jgi:hypothetical protein